MDVHHLRSISEESRVPVFVDSSKRDKTRFPTPSEYEVEFENPLENVIGIDILDATIPNTQYPIDTGTNALCYGITGPRGSSVRGVPDKEAMELVWRLPGWDALRLQCRDQCETGETKRRRVRFLEPGEDVERTASINPTEYAVVTYDINTRKPTSSEARLSAFAAPIAIRPLRDRQGVLQWFSVSGSWRDAPLLEDGRSLAVLPSGAVVAVVAEEASGCPHGVGALTVEAPYITSVYELVPVSSWSPFPNHGATFFVFASRLPVGDHNNPTIVSLINGLMPTRASIEQASDSLSPYLQVESATGLTPTDFTRDRRLAFQGVSPFWIDADISTIADALGFSLLVRDSPAGYSRAIGPSRVFGSTGNNRVIAPGITDLAGERFVVLRCKQFEEMTAGTNTNSAGIGLFKLYNTNVSHLRFDFTHLRKNDIHPITRLSRLTFRFETARGLPYDFKGVNHHLFVAVRTLKPRNTVTMVEPHRSLNGDYDPDVQRYVSRLYNSSSDDDEYDNEFFRTTRR